MGTRPEVIKMAPVILLLKSNKLFACSVCITSQHKELLEDAMKVFAIKPDYDLDIMMHDQDSFDVSAKILGKVKPIIENTEPDLILVQGDTNTAFIAALAGFYAQVKIAHIEAGLRTYMKNEPYPEEINRQMISRLADIHFAPTLLAKQNLLNENIHQSRIYVTGNTGVDALMYILNLDCCSETTLDQSSLKDNESNVLDFVKKSEKHMILVTMHRRENILYGIESFCKALITISVNRDVVIVFSVHPNPNIKPRVQELLHDKRNIFLIPPLSYVLFINMINLCSFIITDSGGIQEEAAMLGKPVLVARNYSDRPESVQAGIAKLVGTNCEKIKNAALRLIDNKEERTKLSRSNDLYGDGHASDKIIEILVKYFRKV